MIINTGQRTDIPAFYSDWFANRLTEGFVCVRNPYYPEQVSRYRLDPSVVDCIGFCTKNPEPMFQYSDLLKEYGQYWFVTITPYGRDIEPNERTSTGSSTISGVFRTRSAQTPSAGGTIRSSFRKSIPPLTTSALLKRWLPSLTAIPKPP